VPAEPGHSREEHLLAPKVAKRTKGAIRGLVAGNSSRVAVKTIEI